MPVISQDPKRRIGAIVVISVLILLFYFLYDYMMSHYTTEPFVLFLLFGFSVMLLVSPLLFEAKKKVPAEAPFTPRTIGLEEKPIRPIVHTCPKCKMLLPRSVWKCPNCGTFLTEGAGLEKDARKLKPFEL